MPRIADDLRALVESEGSRAVARKVITAISEGKVRRKEVSVKQLWEAFVGPVNRTLEYSQRVEGFREMEISEAETSSSAFANIMGHVLMDEAIAAYNRPGFIGERLFRVRTSNRRSERKPGFVLQNDQAEVIEGEPYPQSGMRGRFVSFESGNKRGVLLSLTEEAIFFDETGVLLDRAADIGEFIRIDRETRMLDVFTGEENRYYPEGVQTNIYHSDNKNLNSGNALADWTNLQTALLELAEQEDPEGEIIVIPVRAIVVPWALAATAARILGIIETRVAVDTDDLELTRGHPLSILLEATPQPITSPRLDSYSTTDWWLGDPQRAFLYREHWPFQAFRRRGQQTEDGWHRDVVEQFKFREWGTAHCEDHRYVQKNEA